MPPEVHTCQSWPIGYNNSGDRKAVTVRGLDDYCNENSRGEGSYGKDGKVSSLKPGRKSSSDYVHPSRSSCREQSCPKKVLEANRSCQEEPRREQQNRH